MKESMSVTKGRGSIRHNRRDFYAENIDESRSYLNLKLIDEPIKQAYQRLFDGSLKKYNDRQTRNDRKIKNYYEHIRHSRQEKPFYELVVQLGDRDNSNELNNKNVEILKEFVEKCRERYENVYFFGAYIHLDEATPHLHLDYIPVAHNQKRGLETRNSHNLALKQMGFETYREFRNDMMKLLEGVAKQHDITREVMNDDTKHVPINEYKKRLQIEKNTLDKMSKKIEPKESVLRPSAINKTIGGNVRFDIYTTLYSTFEKTQQHNEVLKEQVANRDEIIASNTNQALKQEICDLKSQIQEKNEEIKDMDNELYELKQENHTLKSQIFHFKQYLTHLDKIIHVVLKKPLNWIFDRLRDIQRADTIATDMTNSLYKENESEELKEKFYDEMLEQGINKICNKELQKQDRENENTNHDELSNEIEKDDYDLEL